MNQISSSSSNYAITPYLPSFLKKKEDPVTIAANQKFPFFTATSPLHLVDRVTHWGKNLLFKDVEKIALNMGKTAAILDKTLLCFILGLQGTMFINSYAHILDTSSHFSLLGRIFTLSALPIIFCFFLLGVLELLAEALYFRGTNCLFKQFKKDEPIAMLQAVQSNYFSLNQNETKNIHSFINFFHSKLSATEKAKHFDSIAKQALAVKLEIFKRRVTPGLAQEVVKELGEVLKNVSSYNPFIRKKAILRAEVLSQSISHQMNNKFLIHLIGVAALSLSCFSMIASYLGIIAGLNLLLLTLLVVMLTITQFVLNKCLIPKGLENHHIKMGKLV